MAGIYILRGWANGSMSMVQPTAEGYEEAAKQIETLRRENEGCPRNPYNMFNDPIFGPSSWSEELFGSNKKKPKNGMFERRRERIRFARIKHYIKTHF